MYISVHVCADAQVRVCVLQSWCRDVSECVSMCTCRVHACGIYVCAYIHVCIWMAECILYVCAHMCALCALLNIYKHVQCSWASV